MKAAVLFLCLFTASATAAELNTNIFFHVNPINSFGGSGYLHVQKIKKSREIEVQIYCMVANALEMQESLRRLSELPCDEFSAWVLIDGGGSLDLKRRSPSLGAHCNGFANAGSYYGCIIFGFSCPGTNKPKAIVIKFKDEYKTFPISAD